MEAYMSQTENKLNIDQLLGNISKNDLIGANRISSNGLATLVENIIHEIMNKEKSEFLNNATKTNLILTQSTIVMTKSTCNLFHSSILV